MRLSPLKLGKFPKERYKHKPNLDTTFTMKNEVGTLNASPNWDGLYAMQLDFVPAQASEGVNQVITNPLVTCLNDSTTRTVRFYPVASGQPVVGEVFIDLETGIIQFNEDDKSKNFQVIYYAKYSLIMAEDFNRLWRGGPEILVGDTGSDDYVDLQSAINNGPSLGTWFTIKLNKDLLLDLPIEISKNVRIDLNGHYVSKNTAENAFILSEDCMIENGIMSGFNGPDDVVFYTVEDKSYWILKNRFEDCTDAENISSVATHYILQGNLPTSINRGDAVPFNEIEISDGTTTVSANQLLVTPGSLTDLGGGIASLSNVAPALYTNYPSITTITAFKPVFRNGSNCEHRTSISAVNENEFLGLAGNAVAGSGTVKVYNEGVLQGLSGLITGDFYWVSKNGTLTNNPNYGIILVGLAVSAVAIKIGQKIPDGCVVKIADSSHLSVIQEGSIIQELDASKVSILDSYSLILQNGNSSHNDESIDFPTSQSSDRNVQIFYLQEIIVSGETVSIFLVKSMSQSGDRLTLRHIMVKNNGDTGVFTSTDYTSILGESFLSSDECEMVEVGNRRFVISFTNSSTGIPKIANLIATSLPLVFLNSTSIAQGTSNALSNQHKIVCYKKGSTSYMMDYSVDYAGALDKQIGYRTISLNPDFTFTLGTLSYVNFPVAGFGYNSGDLVAKVIQTNSSNKEVVLFAARDSSNMYIGKTIVSGTTIDSTALVHTYASDFDSTSDVQMNIAVISPSKVIVVQKSGISGSNFVKVKNISLAPDGVTATVSSHTTSLTANYNFQVSSINNNSFILIQYNKYTLNSYLNSDTDFTVLLEQTITTNPQTILKVPYKKTVMISYNCFEHRVMIPENILGVSVNGSLSGGQQVLVKTKNNVVISGEFNNSFTEDLYVDWFGNFSNTSRGVLNTKLGKLIGDKLLKL